MLILIPVLTLALIAPSPSAATLAKVAVFAANVNRQWPSDDRGPVVTGEALRLMAAAARAIADDRKVDEGKLRDTIADFDSAREALFQHPRGDRKRPEYARAALADGRLVIERLAETLGLSARTSGDRAALKKFVEEFDQDRPVSEQVDDLEQYFQNAAALLKSMLEAA